LGIGLRLAGGDPIPSPSHDQIVACQHADWLDDIIEKILGGGSGGGDGDETGDGEGGEP
jgi:hypothetical protein